MSSLLRRANTCPSKQKQATARTDFELKLQLSSKVTQSTAKQGKARERKAKEGKERESKAKQCRQARVQVQNQFHKAKQGKAKQSKAKQGKAT